MSIFNDNILDFFPEYELNYDNVVIRDDGITLLDFSFFLNPSDLILYIKIEELNSSKSFSGNQILNLFELLLQKISNRYIITLTDTSCIKRGKFKFRLSTLKILLNGISWYNSKGYFQNNFTEEKLNWDLIRELNLMFDSSFIINQIFSVDINSMPLKNVAELIYLNLDVEELQPIFSEMLKQIQIPYTNTLTKRYNV